MRNVLGGDPWDMQERILCSVRDNRITRVRSCHSAAKTKAAAWSVLWFLYDFYPATVISTAPGYRQVESLLWREIREEHGKAKFPLGGSCLTTRIELDSKWFAFGFAAPNYDPDKFMGYHNEHVLVVCDEASGIDDQIYNGGVKAVMSSGRIVRLLMIGNPTKPRGYFYESFKRCDDGSIKISAFDTPNFTTFGITHHDIASDEWKQKITGPLPRPYLVTPEWVASIWEDCGQNLEHPEYRIRVLAEFPEDAEGALFRMDWVEAAQQRTLEPKEGEAILCGIDVARTGANESAMYAAHGNRVRLKSTFNGETIQTAGWVQKHLEEVSPTKPAGIDPVGVGAGVYDLLRERKIAVRAILGGGKVVGSAKNKDRFSNFRAQAYWHLREKFERGEIDIDPLDRKLAEQLMSIGYDYNERGQIRIDSKEKMAAAGKPSPDRADALVYTFASEILPVYDFR